VTSNQTLLGTDQVVLCDATAADVALSLPAAASSNGRMMIIKRVSGNANTSCGVLGIWSADATGGMLLLSKPADGGANQNVIMVLSDGTNWLLLSSR
jgi:hypothetical protein